MRYYGNLNVDLLEIMGTHAVTFCTNYKRTQVFVDT